MPNIKSAIKRVKVAEKANVANSQAKSAMRTTVKKLNKLSLQALITLKN